MFFANLGSKQSLEKQSLAKENSEIQHNHDSLWHVTHFCLESSGQFKDSTQETQMELEWESEDAALTKDPDGKTAT